MILRTKITSVAIAVAVIATVIWLLRDPVADVKPQTSITTDVVQDGGATIVQEEAPPLKESLPENRISLSAESEQWYRNRGYYMDFSAAPGITQPTHSYEALDDQALEQMARTGDMIAAIILGDRLLATTDPAQIEKGLSLHKEAAVLGSTYSANMLASASLSTNMTGDAVRDFEKIRDGLAWYAFASERGDPGGEVGYRLYSDSRELDEGFHSLVCTRARELRAELDSERLQRNLGSFDDSPFPQLSELEPNGHIGMEPCK